MNPQYFFVSKLFRPTFPKMINFNKKCKNMSPNKIYSILNDLKFNVFESEIIKFVKKYIKNKWLYQKAATMALQV